MRPSYPSTTTKTRVARGSFGLATTALIVAALLVFASGAAAETFVGETTTRINGETAETPEGLEVTLVSGSASYETSGSVSITLTTAAAPQTMVEGKPNSGLLTARLTHTEAGGCDPSILFGESFPAAGFSSSYNQPGLAKGALVPSSETHEELPATKVVSGATTTLTLASPRAANLGLNCASIQVFNPSGSSAMVFPLKLVPPPAPPAPPASDPPASAPASTPASPPAKLGIKGPKPVELTVGKWRSVKLTVTNSGGSTLSQGTLRVKPAKGVYLKPESQKLPLLTPGDSFTLSVRVQLTKTAKKKTTLGLTASGAGAITGTGSLIVKAAKK